MGGYRTAPITLLLFRTAVAVCAASIALAFSGCGGGSCGCGASTDAPLSEHNLAYAGDHVVDAQCVCRCGEAEAFSYPADRPCDDYETVCAVPSGRVEHLRCN